MKKKTPPVKIYYRHGIAHQGSMDDGCDFDALLGDMHASAPKDPVMVRARQLEDMARAIGKARISLSQSEFVLDTKLHAFRHGDRNLDDMNEAYREACLLVGQAERQLQDFRNLLMGN